MDMKIEEGYFPDKYTYEFVDQFEPKTIDDIYNLVKDLPVIQTAFIYSDEECENQIPSKSYVFGGRFPMNVDDSKLLGGLYIQIQSLITKYNHVFCRSFPEIAFNNFLGVDEKYVYSRFIVAEGDYK